MPETQTAIRFASAVSTADSAAAAVAEVTDALHDALAAPVDLAVVFASTAHREAIETIRDRLRQTLAPQVLIGCTAQGVVGVQQELEEGPALSVLAGTLPGATLHAFRCDQPDWPKVTRSPARLREAVQGTIDEGAAKAVILLADPFTTPLVRFLPALDEAVPGAAVVGGIASGGEKAGDNRLLLDDAVIDEGAVGVTLAGDIDVQTTVSQGCRPIGQPLIITRAKRHVVQQLGGRSALQVIQEMAQDLDDEDQQLVHDNGLLVGRVINEYKQRFGRGDFVVRGLVGVDQDQGYIAIGDPQVRVGQTVQFHVRDQKTAAEDLAMMLDLQKVHGPAAGGLLFTCNGRGTNLFDEPNTDVNLIHAALGQMPLAGFFAAGELGPLGPERASFVHGHTASLIAFRSAGNEQDTLE
ncbi:MAG: FIST signal transduction protein [Phycisphaeraceae bacterium]